MSETPPIQVPSAEGEKAVAILQAMKERKLGQLQGRSDAYSDAAWKNHIYALSLIILALASAPTPVGLTFAIASIGASSLGLFYTFCSSSIKKETKEYAKKEGLKIETEELK